MDAGLPPPSSPEFLARGGEMGALMRAHNWSVTALGAPQDWPQALRTSIRLILNTGHPMYVFWGDDLLCFYNDSYRLSIGPERHPGSLGRPGREVWDEIWDVIGPQIGQIMAGGPATWHENHLIPITRDGQREDVYWTYSYGPIDDTGALNGVGGVLVVCNETTASVMAERRLAEAASRQRRMFEQAPGFITVMRGRDHVVEFVNAMHRRLFNSQDWIGRPIREAIPDISGQGYFERLDAVFTRGEPYRGISAQLEFRRTPDGPEEKRFLDFVYAPIVGDDGEISGIFCNGFDVTERVRAELALRESEARFTDVADAAPVLIWMSDTSKAHIWFNKPWLAFTGRTMQEECGDGWAEGVHPDDLAHCLAVYQGAFDRQERFRMDYRLRQADGRWRMVDDTGLPRFGSDGTFLGYIGTCVDVTEFRESEAALRRSEEQRRLAIEASEVGLWDVDVVSDTLFWPPRVKAMFGISPDVPVSMADFFNGLHPDDRDRTGAAYAAAADPARRLFYDVEYRTIGKEDGVIRWLAAKGRGVFDSDGRCLRMIGTVIDITSRKLAERRLQESEASLAQTVATLDALLANAPIGFAFFDPSHRYVRLNSVLAGINELPVEAHLGRSIEQLQLAEAATAAPMIDLVVASGRAIEAVEIEGVGARCWLTSFFPVLEANGAVSHVGVTMIDISARKRAEAAVRDLNHELEAKVDARTAERDRLWRNSRDLQVVIDLEGVFHAVSPAATSILGWQPAEMIGRSVFDFIQDDDLAGTRTALVHVRGAPLPTFENRYAHKDGGFRWISWVAAREADLIYGSGRDVTAERVQAQALAVAEDALRQSQKMEAVGQLTGGIAHDFNNLLQGVAGSLDLIRRKAEDVQLVRRWAEAGLQAAERGAKLTGQLLAFSRSQKLELKPLAVSALVGNMRDLLERTLGVAVRIRLDLEPGGVSVLGDETQLEMALLNLAINARDAMADGGDVTIATRVVSLEEAPDVPVGDYVELSVSDTGVGMPADVVARAFDPFFTTKGVGKGTGLGLSQVYGMVRQAGGTVRIESRVGQGTTVRLFLRQTDPVAPESKSPVEGGAAVSRLAATILVVDDDHDVRRFLVASLEALGYKPLEAEDGKAGLAALDQFRPDAMIVDFAMPGMTGAEVAREAWVLRPDLPIIFATGYSETAAIEQVAGSKAAVLRKPFRVNELNAILTEVLRRSNRDN